MNPDVLLEEPDRRRPARLPSRCQGTCNVFPPLCQTLSVLHGSGIHPKVLTFAIRERSTLLGKACTSEHTAGKGAPSPLQRSPADCFVQAEALSAMGDLPPGAGTAGCVAAGLKDAVIAGRLGGGTDTLSSSHMLAPCSGRGLPAPTGPQGPRAPRQALQGLCSSAGEQGQAPAARGHRQHPPQGRAWGLTRWL